MKLHDVRALAIKRTLWIVLVGGLACLWMAESFDESTFYVIALLEFLAAAVLVIMYPPPEEEKN